MARLDKLILFFALETWLHEDVSIWGLICADRALNSHAINDLKIDRHILCFRMLFDEVNNLRLGKCSHTFIVELIHELR